MAVGRTVRWWAAMLMAGMVCGALASTARTQEHDDLARLIAGVSRLQGQGRYAEAIPMAERAVALAGERNGEEHTEFASVINWLARVYHAEGRYAEAEPAYKRSLAIREKALGPEHADVGQSLNSLALLYGDQGRYAEAEPLAKRSLAIREKALEPDHADLAQSLNSLAVLYHGQGRYAEAEPLARRSLAIREKALGLEHPDVGESLKSLAQLNHRQGRYAEAERLLRRSLAIREKVLGPEHPDVGEALNILAMLFYTQGRHAIVDRLATVDARLAEIDRRLAREFPDYALLVSQAPISLAEVQTQLRADEALVLFLHTAKSKPAPEDTFIWVATRSGVRWVRSELGTAALTREVAALRCGLDATAWDGDGAEKCATALGIPLAEVPRHGQPLPFDHPRAHKLYLALFGEVRDLIKGKHLLTVPSGPLTQLPFHVLVTRPSASGDHRAAGAREPSPAGRCADSDLQNAKAFLVRHSKHRNDDGSVARPYRRNLRREVRCGAVLLVG